MLRNFLKTAFRNLVREKGSSMLNIAGLTLGITSSLVLFLLVKHMVSYDRYHSRYERIFRVVTESDGNNGKFYTPGVPPALPDAFREDFHQATEVTFASYRPNAIIQVIREGEENKKYFEEGGVVFAQPNFFKIFDRAILTGDAARALDEPSEAIISVALAKKYFGRDDVIGSVIKFDSTEFRITAVMEDYPDNTDFPFNLMLSFATIKKQRDEVGWRGIWSDEQCYILLDDATHAAAIQAGMPAFVNKYLGKDNYNNQSFTLQPLSAVHEDERYSNFNYRTAPREMMIALTIIAVFLIITACINFINLSTAEAIKRSKEVGIRKALGSSRFQLILQFLGETSIITVAAMTLALGLTQLALGFINPFLEVSLALDFGSDVYLWVFVLAVTGGVSFLSGLYPSLIISGFKPVLALKNQISNRSSSGFVLRKSLVVLQFVISQFFIMGTIVLVSQMDYFQQQELGFRKDAILIVPVPEPGDSRGAEASKLRTLREEIARMGGVEQASLSSTPPASGIVNGTGFYFEGTDENTRIDNQVKQIDGHYLSLYGIELVAGKNLDDADTANGFLVNEELVRIAGFTSPDAILGKRIHMWGRVLPVVGVVRDFHAQSLRERIEPVIMMNNMRGYHTLSVKINQARVDEVIGALRTKWEEGYPDQIFDYSFFDDSIREFYEGEKKMSVLLATFTGLAILIGCLGLFGLATFMANQKTKEIGVRKALGASVESIVFLFSKEYVKLILIGFLLASPAVWLLMNKWLETFAYRISIGPLTFLAGFGITLTIAILTVGYKSLMAALVNPIRSLRYE